MNTNENHAEARKCFVSRLDDIREALADPGKRDELAGNCLFIEAHIAVNIQLSTGGPGDGFEIICHAATGQPLHGCHYFINWGFRKEVALSADELAKVCAVYAIEDGRLFLPDHPR